MKKRMINAEKKIAQLCHLTKKVAVVSPTRQCAAVTTHCSAINVPPQNMSAMAFCPFRDINIACQVLKGAVAGIPPIILVCAPWLRRNNEVC